MSFGKLYASNEFMFCELHDALSRFLSSFRDYIDPLLDSNGYEPFVATLCIGMIAAMRVDKVHLFGLLEAYIVTVKELARTKAKPVQTQQSFSLFSFFFSKRITRFELREEIPSRVSGFFEKEGERKDFGSSSHSRFEDSSHSRFEDLLRDTDLLFNEGVECGSTFHEHYIFYLGIILESYKRFMDEATRRKAVNNLVESHYLNFWQNFYDNFDSDEVIRVYTA